MSSKVVDFGRLVDDVKQTGKPAWRCYLAPDEVHDVVDPCPLCDEPIDAPASRVGTLQDTLVGRRQSLSALKTGLTGYDLLKSFLNETSYKISGSSGDPTKKANQPTRS